MSVEAAKAAKWLLYRVRGAVYNGSGDVVNCSELLKSESRPSACGVEKTGP